MSSSFVATKIMSKADRKTDKTNKTKKPTNKNKTKTHHKNKNQPTKQKKT